MSKKIYSVLALALASCGSNEAAKTPADQITFNDFEAVDGWGTSVPVPSLTKEKARSGTYSIRVAPGCEYSIGYTNPLGKLSATRLKKITIAGWVWLPSKDAKAKLVVTFDNINPDKNLKYDALDLAPTANKFGSWVEVTKTIEVPIEASYNTQLKVYLWRADSSQPVYLDDLEIKKAE